jgi:hypothetical protein
MSTLLASHTMPSLDELFASVAVVLAFLFGAFALPLAASHGAKAGAALPYPRHLLAMLVGLVPGAVALAEAVLVIVALLPGAVGGSIVLALGSWIGVVAAYPMAKAAATRLSWYDCQICGGRFRSRSVARHCPPCAAREDQIAMARALADFPARYQALHKANGEERTAEPRATADGGREASSFGVQASWRGRRC